MSQRRVQRRTEFNILTDQRPKHLLQTGDNSIQVQDLRVQHLLPTKRQKLASQVGCAMPRLFDFFDILPQRGILSNAFSKKLAVANDHTQ